MKQRWKPDKFLGADQGHQEGRFHQIVNVAQAQQLQNRQKVSLELTIEAQLVLRRGVKICKPNFHLST